MFRVIFEILCVSCMSVCARTHVVLNSRGVMFGTWVFHRLALQRNRPPQTAVVSAPLKQPPSRFPTYTAPQTRATPPLSLLNPRRPCGDLIRFDFFSRSGEEGEQQNKKKKKTPRGSGSIQDMASRASGRARRKPPVVYEPAPVASREKQRSEQVPSNCGKHSQAVVVHTQPFHSTTINNYSYSHFPGADGGGGCRGGLGFCHPGSRPYIILHHGIFYVSGLHVFACFGEFRHRPTHNAASFLCFFRADEDCR